MSATLLRGVSSLLAAGVLLLTPGRPLSAADDNAAEAGAAVGSVDFEARPEDARGFGRGG